MNKSNENDSASVSMHVIASFGSFDETKKNNIMTLDQFKDKHYGARGTVERGQLEAGYQNFKIGALIHEARLEKGLTQ